MQSRHDLEVGPARRRLAGLVLACTVLTACKGGRSQLEGLVPDGATGILSVDGSAFVGSETYRRLRALAKDQGVEDKLAAVRDECKVDLDGLQQYVVGFDALGGNTVIGLKLPRLGTKAALECTIAKLELDPEHKLTIAEQDGRASITGADGAKAFALDDDTLVAVTKGWAEAVTALSQGKGKAAIDNNLAKAAALADHKRHGWFAAEVPALVEGKLDETPAKGLLRGGGDFELGATMALALAVEFRDEASATAAKDALDAQFDAAKVAAVTAGIPATMFESFTMSRDGAILRASVQLPLAELVETSIKAFTSYMGRAKTAEVRVGLGSLWRGIQSAAGMERLGPDGNLVLTSCPSDGRSEGTTGVTPPLSVDCSKGCTPGVEYEATLWRDNPVWSAIGFEPFERHRFHYEYAWKDDGKGRCDVTLRAHGDLDGDKTYSTFERKGTASVDGLVGDPEPTATDELE
ncbi:MAG: hypothetical protein K1X88_30005 [Nannocystaceae bacterium]|nr:hypothetical protein [Nannocystaceae bacterium]